MKGCLTKKLVFREVSGCLVEKPECSYARKFGFSFVCLHPDHQKFHVHVSGVMSRIEANERYEELRVKRHDEFIAGLDEEGRRYFCHKTDFHGQPLSE